MQSQATVFEHVFSFSQSLLGKNAQTAIYSISMEPSDDSKTTYAELFRASYRVELLEAEIAVDAGVSPADKAGFWCSATIAHKPTTTSLHTVHNVGMYSGISTSNNGKSSSISLARTTGLRRVLKGVADDGVLPHFVVAATSGFDATSVIAAHVRASYKVRFHLGSSYQAYQDAMQLA